MSTKLPTSFRLAKDAIDAIRDLASLRGTSQAEAVEYLAREWRKKHLSESAEARFETVEARLQRLEEKVGG